MLAWAVALYFVLVVGLLALVLFQAPRQWLEHAWQRSRAKLQKRSQQLSQVSAQEWQRTAQQTQHQWRRSNVWLRQHMLWLIIAACLIVVPPLVAFGLRQHHTLDPYSEDAAQDPDTLVASLLQGEQLVPPPPLPPDIFTTAEVELVRPKLATADRKWELLDEEFRQRLLLAFKLMHERHGYEMALLEGYRSPERQAMLQDIGPHVTNAGAFQSYHQYGLAADCAFLRNGKLVISEKDPWTMQAYQAWGEVSESLGLTWGGRWKLMDFGHVELRRKGVLGRH